MDTDELSTLQAHAASLEADCQTKQNLINYQAQIIRQHEAVKTLLRARIEYLQTLVTAQESALQRLETQRRLHNNWAG